MMLTSALTSAIVLLAVSVALVSCSAHPVFSFDNIFKMYAYQKIFDSCFGVRTSSQWVRDMKDAKASCEISTREDMRDEIREYYSTQRPTTTTTGRYQLASEEQVQFSKHRVGQLAVALQRRNAYLNCTFNQLKIINTGMQLDTSNQLQQYQGLRIAPSLRNELKKGINECFQLTTCLPMMDYSGLTSDLKKALVYSVCEKKRRALACIRHDLRERSAMFELAGLEGVTLDSGNPEDQAELDTKTTLFWADNAYGNDIFGIMGL